MQHSFNNVEQNLLRDVKRLKTALKIIFNNKRPSTLIIASEYLHSSISAQDIKRNRIFCDSLVKKLSSFSSYFHTSYLTGPLLD